MSRIKNQTLSPVIIIGMHRSGTSMISRMLEDLGVFMGYKKQRDHESLFFLKINEWLLRQCGGSWDNPKAFQYLEQNQEVKSLAIRYIRFIMNTPRIINYLGVKSYIKYHSPEALDFSWGWKDPRNTFTLPLWLEIFPDAKVIHIYRNGIDVANSLNVREEKQFRKRSHPVIDPYKRSLYIFRPKRGGFTNSLRCASLEGSFSLWEEYVSMAQSHVRRLGDRAFEIKYEGFIENPVITLKSLSEFCGLSASDDEIIQVSKHVNKSRVNAYRNKPELLQFSNKVVSRLSAKES